MKHHEEGAMTHESEQKTTHTHDQSKVVTGNANKGLFKKLPKSFYIAAAFVVAALGGYFVYSSFATTEVNGLSAVYYNNKDFTGSSVSKVDSQVNFNWGTAVPVGGIDADTFSARWQGQVLAPSTGLYEFSTSSDDGMRVWVNNELVVNTWTNHGSRVDSGTIKLTAGTRYPIRVEYFDNAGSAEAVLRWSIAFGAITPVPAANLFTTAVTSDPPPPVLPAISSFSANTTSITSGQSVTFNWTTTSASSCVFNPGSASVSVNGTRTVSNITANTTYSLSCSNAAGTTTSSPVTVTVTPPVTWTPAYPGQPRPGKMYYGSSVEGGNPAAWETANSSDLAVYRSYMSANDSPTNFTNRARDDVSNGRLPLISTKVPNDNWAAVANGSQDTWLLARIRALAAVPGPVWLALHHEPYGDGQPADWVRMQQHARQLIDANSTNITLVGILNGYDFKARDRNPSAWNHPVGTGVEAMGFDSYNPWSPTNGKNWQDASYVFSPGLVIQSWGYPTFVGEYGVREDPSNPGRAAQWMRDAYSYALQNNFVAISYFNSGQNSPDGTWELTGERLDVFVNKLRQPEVMRL